MDDGLKDLIARGPYPKYPVAAAVIRQLDEITEARRLLWPWPEIAEAMGFPNGKWRAVAKAYRSAMRKREGLPAARRTKVNATPTPAPIDPSRLKVMPENHQETVDSPTDTSREPPAFVPTSEKASNHVRAAKAAIQGLFNQNR